MKEKKHFIGIILISVMVMWNACEKTENKQVTKIFSNGIFIVNEGPFQTGSGTITYFDPDSNLARQDIFQSVNGRPLGNIVQSMCIFGQNAHIVVNNAAKVEVVDAASFASLAVIDSGLQLPRYFLGIDEKKAYVTDWAGFIAVVDLTSHKVIKTIPAGQGPELMVKSGKYLFVTNCGAFGTDSTLTVIDFLNDNVVKTIRIGDVPIGMVVGKDGEIWVLCKGKGYTLWPSPDDTPGRLVKINPSTLEFSIEYQFSKTTDHPEELAIDLESNSLFYLYNNGIYRFNLNLNHPLPQPVVQNRYFYTLGYESSSGYLYAGDPRDFSQDGIVIRYKATDGSPVDSIPAGIIPGGFVFRDK